LNVSGPLNETGWTLIAFLLSNGYMTTGSTVSITTSAAIPAPLLNDSSWSAAWDYLAHLTEDYPELIDLNVTLDGIDGVTDRANELAVVLAAKGVEIIDLTLKDSSFVFPVNLDVDGKIILEGVSDLDVSALPLARLMDPGAAGVGVVKPGATPTITLPAGLSAAEAAAIIKNLVGEIPQNLVVKSGDQTYTTSDLAPPQSSSGGGCNAGFGWFALLAGAILIRRSKR
jgi:Synergist-CTERM protein sorting domain-containing protein